MARFFVYGTLRPAARCWVTQIAPAIPGTATGALYDYGGYPYADFDGDGTIHGDIITTDEVGAARITRVEEGAGYELRFVLVDVGGRQEEVAAWDATARTKEATLPKLPLIPSGDWVTYEDSAEQEAAWADRRRAFTNS